MALLAGIGGGTSPAAKKSPAANSGVMDAYKYQQKTNAPKTTGAQFGSSTPWAQAVAKNTATQNKSSGGSGIATPTSSSGSTAPSGPTTSSTGALVAPAVQKPENTELYKTLLGSDYLDWQKQRGEEMLRLKNFETELFGQGGKVQQEGTTDFNERRRLAAQMAAAGTLQGGAYAGGERGLDTLARVDQTNQMNELIRPFIEQTSTDRLAQYGIGFDAGDTAPQLPGVANTISSYGGTFANAVDAKGKPVDWTKTTWAGQEAAQRARAAALQALLSRMTTI